jgi:hypothetical protein
MAAVAGRTAVAWGPTAKIRAALTRQSKASKVTPIGKAGAKAKFDPDTMEGVGGTTIPDGADVIVVRRGARIEGIETPEKATVRLATLPTPATVAGRTAPGPAYETRMTELEASRTAKQTKPARQLGGGSTSDVSLLTHGDRQVVEKVAGRRSGIGKTEVAKELDAEELAPMVVESFGVRSAAVIRTAPDKILMEFVEEGTTWAEAHPGYGGIIHPFQAEADALTGSDDGRLLGLADYIMGNTDRNSGNFMYRTVHGGREITAIDHGYAFADQGGNHPPSGFFGDFLLEPGSFSLALKIDVNPADLAIVRRRIEALRPRFVDAKRKAWYDAMIRRLKVLEQRADPNAAIRLAVTT